MRKRENIPLQKYVYFPLHTTKKKKLHKICYFFGLFVVAFLNYINTHINTFIRYVKSVKPSTNTTVTKVTRFSCKYKYGQQ